MGYKYLKEMALIMIIECLARNTFDKNMQDFSRCESQWKVFSEVDEKFVKDSFVVTAEILKSTSPDENVDFCKWENIKEQLESGRVVGDPLMLYRIKSDLPHCPLCGGSYSEENHEYATSRRDNKTKICSQCGMKEAFEDMLDERG